MPSGAQATDRWLPDGGLARATFRAAVLIPLGALVCSVAFDIVSQRDGDQFIYAKGGYLLTAMGLIGGAVAAVAAVPVLLQMPREERSTRVGVRALLLMDAGLAVFAVLFLLRHRAGSLEPVSVPFLGLAAVGAILLVGSAALSPALTPRFRTEPEPDAHEPR